MVHPGLILMDIEVVDIVVGLWLILLLDVNFVLNFDSYELRYSCHLPNAGWI